MSERLHRHLLCGFAALFAGGAALAAGIPDPLRPPVHGAPQQSAASAPAALQLQATRVGHDDRYAVIDGATVRRGERIGDAVVVRIEAASVTLRDEENGERVLRFDAPGISKRPAGSNGKQQ